MALKNGTGTATENGSEGVGVFSFQPAAGTGTATENGSSTAAFAFRPATGTGTATENGSSVAAATFRPAAGAGTAQEDGKGRLHLLPETQLTVTPAPATEGGFTLS